MASPEPGTNPSPPRPTRTLRFICEYDGNQVRLISQQSVAMIPPPPTAQRGPNAEQAGFWYELRDAQDHSVYHRAVANPIPMEREVFSQDPDESIHRQEAEVGRETFVLLAPDMPEATSVVLFSSPPPPTGMARETMAREASEWARFDLARERET